MRALVLTVLAMSVVASGCGGDEAPEFVGRPEQVAPPTPPTPTADSPPFGGIAGNRAEPSFDEESKGTAPAIEMAEAVGQTAGATAPLPVSMASVQQARADSAPSMIIRTGRASVEVDSLEAAVANVQALALRVGGYVANVTLQTGRTQLRQGTLEMKVPASRFDEAIEGLRPLGKLQGLDVTAQDVGEEYVDVTARMTSARRLEERLIALLANRTGKLEEVLSVERELARVRQEIERYEGRLRYLRTRASMSTLFVSVYEPPPILAASVGRNPIVIAFRNAWRNFVGFVAVLIESLGVVLPIAAILAVLVLAWRRYRPRIVAGTESSST
ncbi:MAG TPA: DUF4349 domain-containing protein [Gemmatimonadaceae bacterium]|nr:DUF4349 domain-containing protein [Gemmatimonadaceae bacterium]